MPKSKNRPNHKQKLAARRQKINETTNMKKKQLNNWIAEMQRNIAAQNVQPSAENVIDVTEATDNVLTPNVENIQIVEEITEPPSQVGGSGQL